MPELDGPRCRAAKAFDDLEDPPTLCFWGPSPASLLRFGALLVGVLASSSLPVAQRQKKDRLAMAHKT